VTQVTTKVPAHHVYCSTIHKLWKQPRSPKTNEWIKKMWYLYRMAFYSATKKNEILSFAGKWMDLKNMILSEASQAQKAYFLSSVDFRHKTDAVKLDMGRTLRGDHIREG
jgi:hypothetical protein